MTRRKDALAKETTPRKPREFHQGRFGGRYHARKQGVGHPLSSHETRALLLEQLSDFVKPGLPNKVWAADVILTEFIDPPDEILLKMVAAVEGLTDPSHMDIARTMAIVYAKLQWGLDLHHDHGDKRYRGGG